MSMSMLFTTLTIVMLLISNVINSYFKWNLHIKVTTGLQWLLLHMPNGLSSFRIEEGTIYI